MSKVHINDGDDDRMEIRGYSPSMPKTILTWTAIVATIGILRLVFHWKPHWMLLCTHSRSELDVAKKVLLIDQYQLYYTETVVLFVNDNRRGRRGSVPHDWILLPKVGGEFEFASSYRYFENKKVRYVWDEDLKLFAKLRGIDKDVLCTYFYEHEGMTASDQRKRQMVYGLNEIIVEVQSVIAILLNGVLEPFYIFQVFSVAIWMYELYFYYSICIIVMSALSLGSSVIQTRRNQKQLRETVKGHGMVMVCRGEERYEKIDSTNLVPGDLIEIPSLGCTLLCDAVLVSGNAIVNEAMLTGESIPVTKTPLPSTSASLMLDHKEHSKHILFCGTHVIQTRSFNQQKVKAVVMRTGYQTAKGELIRSIMFPKPVDFKFNRHIHKFIGFLAVLALIGFTYTVVLKTMRKQGIQQIIMKAVDLVTIIIPPSLPVAMTIGVVFAQSRLKFKEIFCIAPAAINISGCVNCVCFDKTGTLTEDDLNFSEVVQIDPQTKQFDQPVSHPATELERGPMMISLATCHSLSFLSGTLIGDPLDQKMFAAIDWTLEEPETGEDGEEEGEVPIIVTPKTDGAGVAILRQYDFSSSLQRMSVITREVGSQHFELYAKGSPEMIQALSLPDSMPLDFDKKLQQYTDQGCRVLALAYRKLDNFVYTDVQKASREALEKDLTFLGLLIMENMLKPETTPIIRQLIMANIRPIMVTGDNMLTALSVARECSMVQPWHKAILLETEQCKDHEVPQLSWRFATNTAEVIHNVPDYQLAAVSNKEHTQIHVAVTGSTFKVLKEYYPDLLRKVAIRGTVFARMAPEQKQQLVELLQDLGYYVGMCGDGANDCGALKAAHVGVSLAESEASIAAPFTSKQQNISCVPILIREGRAAIVTAFGILKCTACYSMTQFISMLILYAFYSSLTDYQFLYCDLLVCIPMIMLFGRNHAYEKLDPQPPSTTLIGFVQLSSLLFQILLVLGTQVLAHFVVQMQPWYDPHITDDQYDVSSHDNYAIFATSVFQYITLAVVFSKGTPYRQPIYKNYLFFACFIAVTALTVYIVFYPADFVINILAYYLEGVTIWFRGLMLILAFAHFVLANFAEMFIVDFLFFKKFTVWFPSLRENKQEYQRLDAETRGHTRWLLWSGPHSDPDNQLTMLKRQLNDKQVGTEEKDTKNGVHLNALFGKQSYKLS